MIIGEKYRLIRPLKKSGMSTVYLAEDLRLHMKWAIKVISCDELYLADSVISEANVLRSIKHPNLVRITDIFKWEDKACLVMEYVEGKNLSDLIRENPGLVTRNAFDFTLQLLHALKALHERKNPVIYRDMKPENIMVRPDLTVCLIDFGTSKKYEKGGEDAVSLGTRRYAAPEQLKGITDVRSDIFSLGRTMERMAGSSKDRALKAVIKKAVEADPEKRYQSADSMERDLMRRKGLRGRILIVSVLLFCIALVISALYYGYLERQKNVLIADAYRKAIEEGNEAMYDGDLSLAEKHYTRAIVEINGYEHEAYLRLLKLYRKAKAPLEGLERMDGYISSGYGGTDKMNDLLYECAITAFEDLRDFKKAVSYFSRTDRKDYPETEYLLNISDYLSSLDKEPIFYLRNMRDFRDYTDTVADRERKIKSKLIFTDMCLILSEEAGRRGNKESPKEVAAVLTEGYSQGKELMRLLEDNTAGEEYERQSLNMMSAICRLLGEKFPEKRREYFKEALSYMDMADLLDKGDGDPGRYTAMAKLYQGIGDDKNACLFYKKAECSGDAANAYTEHMKYLESKKRYGELLKVYKDSLSVDGIQETKEFQKLTKNMEKMELLKG